MYVYTVHLLQIIAGRSWTTITVLSFLMPLLLEFKTVEGDVYISN
jgi:hypothetical protein